MNKTINQLSDLTQVENDDELVVWDITAGTSKKAKARQFKNIFISASSTTVTGAGIVSGSVVKIMFTSAITGSDTTTGMSISYNGTSIPVKVGKQGSLVDFVAHDISGTYTYLQAYTTLELAFDGTQFVVIGNPIVLSSDDYTIYADGQTRVNYVAYGDMGMVTSNAVYNFVKSQIKPHKITIQWGNVSANNFYTKSLATVTNNEITTQSECYGFCCLATGGSAGYDSQETLVITRQGDIQYLARLTQSQVSSDIVIWY